MNAPRPVINPAENRMCDYPQDEPGIHRMPAFEPRPEKYRP